MLLSPIERLNILGILPKEGNFATLRIVRQLENSLSFSEEEFHSFGVIQEGNLIRVKDNTQEVDISIGEKATDLIVKSLKDLNKAGKLTMAHFGIYEKFVEVGEN